MLKMPRLCDSSIVIQIFAANPQYHVSLYSSKFVEAILMSFTPMLNPSACRFNAYHGGAINCQGYPRATWLMPAKILK